MKQTIFEYLNPLRNNFYLYLKTSQYSAEKSEAFKYAGILKRSRLNWWLFNSLTTTVPHHIETSQLIYDATQLTGSYMKGNIGR